MFAKVLAVIFAVAVGANAHAGVTPALGVQGQLTRNQVQRPSNQKPCGNANLNAVGTSTPVTAGADGTFTVTAINFNGGRDGSRQFTAKVDASGAGNAFNGNVQITQNGDAAPSGTGTQQITAKLPAGTQCQGGRCLVSFTSAGGFGNCVVVQQGGAGGGAAAGGAQNNGGAAGGAAGNGQGNNNGQQANNNGQQNGQQANNGQNGQQANNGNGRGRGRGRGRNGQNRQAGTRAARFVRYVLAESEQ